MRDSNIVNYNVNSNISYKCSEILMFRSLTGNEHMVVVTLCFLLHVILNKTYIIISAWCVGQNE